MVDEKELAQFHELGKSFDPGVAELHQFFHETILKSPFADSVPEFFLRDIVDDVLLVDPVEFLKRSSNARSLKEGIEATGRVPNKSLSRRANLTPSELNEAGLRFSDKTQFETGVLDLPEFFKTPGGKVLTQFTSLLSIGSANA